MTSLVLSDLNVLEEVSYEEMIRLEGGVASGATAAATVFGATSAGVASPNENVVVISGLPQPAPNPAPFSEGFTTALNPVFTPFTGK